MRQWLGGSAMRRGVAVVALATAMLLPNVGFAQGSVETQIELTASAPSVTYGDAVRFRGLVTSPDAPECTHGAEVVVQMDAIDDGELWIEVARARTDSDGSFSADVIAEQSALYVATTVADEARDCEPAGSNGVEVYARFRVTVERSARAVPAGERVRLTVNVEPICPYDRRGDVAKIPLYQMRGGELVRIDAKRDPNDCTVTFSRRIRRLSVFASKVRGTEGTNSVYLPGRSAEVAVDVRR